MAIIKYEGVGIAAIAAAVPRTIINNYQYTTYFDENQVKEVVDKIGVFERRFVDNNTCSSDLCFAAAQRLIEDNNVNKNEIDLLVFLSQTPDYRMPATSIILQERLGLSNSTIAFDISLGCSGFIYGINVLFAFMQNAGIRKALLLNGETRSKVYSCKDRRTAFLFGDGGAAVLVERNEKYSQSFFSLNSDGSKANLIMIKGGGYRFPSSIDTLTDKIVDEYGNIRNDEQGYMNGADVFNFVIREIPKDVKCLLEYANVDKELIDYFIFHQANQFINSYIMKKMHLDPLKVPSSIAKYGNTSSVSLPLTIVDQFENTVINDKNMLLSAFGVGMTWATSIMNFRDCKISKLVEV